MARNMAVFGLYATPDIAENAVDHLITVGFTNSDISVLLPDDESTRAFAHEKHTKAPEGTATGAATGGVIGGTLGLLAGIGAIAIPGVGPLIVAGPIISALAGLGAGGAVGGVVGALVGMGIPEYEAKRFEGAVKNGGTLLSVHCETPDEITMAKQALKETGAHDIAASGEESSPAATEADSELRYAYLKDAGTLETASADVVVHDQVDEYELQNAYLRDSAIRTEHEDFDRATVRTSVAGVPPVDTYDGGFARDRAQAGENLALTGSSSDARGVRG